MRSQKIDKYTINDISKTSTIDDISKTKYKRYISKTSTPKKKN